MITVTFAPVINNANDRPCNSALTGKVGSALLEEATPKWGARAAKARTADFPTAAWRRNARAAERDDSMRIVSVQRWDTEQSTFLRDGTRVVRQVSSVT